MAARPKQGELDTAAKAFERRVQYLKKRKQLGVPVGSFQALKRRAPGRHGG